MSKKENRSNGISEKGKKTSIRNRVTWSPKLVNVKDVKATPGNYKIKTQLGRERLTQSLEIFGLAGTVVVNTDLSLIDGNSRIEQAKERGEKKVWVSIPNRKLTPAEYKEMSAMYDFAKAGEVDEDRIKGELGKTKDFFEKWGMEIPQELLGKLGKGNSIDNYIEEGDTKSKGKKSTLLPAPDKEVQMMITLFYSEPIEKKFRKMEEILKKKFKVDGVSEIVFKAFEKLTK